MPKSEIYDKISGAFGMQDCLLAIHPLDSKRAFEYLLNARAAELSCEDVELDVITYLKSRGCSDEHIEEQKLSARRHFGPWLWGEYPEHIPIPGTKEWRQHVYAEIEILRDHVKSNLDEKHAIAFYATAINAGWLSASSVEHLGAMGNETDAWINRARETRESYYQELPAYKPTL